nr:hypothetical protein [Tanacetum cinerariifolium]
MRALRLAVMGNTIMRGCPPTTWASHYNQVIITYDAGILALVCLWRHKDTKAGVVDSRIVDKEEVFDEEVMTQVNVLMALADDELMVEKNHARNHKWIEITIRKTPTNPESSKESGSKPLTPLPSLKNLQEASPSYEVMPLTYQDHSLRERTGLGTMKHTKPETQESLSKSVSGPVTVCDTELGPPDLINNDGTQEQEYHNNSQPTEKPLGNNTETLVLNSEPSVPKVTQSQITHHASTSSHPAPQDSCECLFENFLFEIEPKKVSEALKHPRWVDVMQEELNQFYKNKVWTLVPLSEGKDDKGISICQEKHTMDVLKKYEISDSSLVKTPMVFPNNLGLELADIRPIQKNVISLLCKESLEKAPQVFVNCFEANWFVGVKRNISQWPCPLSRNYLREFWYTAEVEDPISPTDVFEVLGGNHSSTEQVNFSQQMIIYCLFTGTKIVIEEIIYNDLVTRLMNKSRQKQNPLIPKIQRKTHNLLLRDCLPPNPDEDSEDELKDKSDEEIYETGEEIAKKSDNPLDASDSESSPCSKTFKPFDNYVPISERVLVRNLQGFSEDPALYKKVLEATKAYIKNSTNLTEHLTLVKNFNFPGFKTIVESLQATLITQNDHLAKWDKSFAFMAWTVGLKMTRIENTQAGESLAHHAIISYIVPSLKPSRPEGEKADMITEEHEDKKVPEEEPKSTQPEPI